jgi:hypothetical protein
VVDDDVSSGDGWKLAPKLGLAARRTRSHHTCTSTQRHLRAHLLHITRTVLIAASAKSNSKSAGVPSASGPYTGYAYVGTVQKTLHLCASSAQEPGCTSSSPGSATTAGKRSAERIFQVVRPMISGIDHPRSASWNEKSSPLHAISFCPEGRAAPATNKTHRP